LLGRALLRGPWGLLVVALGIAPAAVVTGAVTPVVPALPLTLSLLRTLLAFRGRSSTWGGLPPLCRRLLVLFCHICQTDQSGGGQK
jgi:hypothetical protein